MIAKMYHIAVDLGKTLLFFGFSKTISAHLTPQLNSFLTPAETESVRRLCNVQQSPKTNKNNIFCFRLLKHTQSYL